MVMIQVSLVFSRTLCCAPIVVKRHTHLHSQSFPSILSKILPATVRIHSLFQGLDDQECGCGLQGGSVWQHFVPSFVYQKSPEAFERVFQCHILQGHECASNLLGQNQRSTQRSVKR